MSGPPDNIAPDTLWTQMTQLPRPYREVDFPRKDPITGDPMGQVVMTVLTQEEQMLCSSRAEEFTRKVLKSVPKNDEARRGYDDLYDNAGACEILFLAVRRKSDPKLHFFPSVEKIRKELTADEVGMLMLHYFTVQREVGPQVSTMSEEEVDAWVKRLTEGGSAFPLDLLSLGALRSLVLSLAKRQAISATDTTSPGSPLDEFTSTPSIEPFETLAPDAEDEI